MPITPGIGEFWKEYKGQLKKSMDFISEHGLSVLDRNEIKRISYPIIREAKRRMRELEKNGMTDSPAYRYVMRHKINFTAGGKNLNNIRHNLQEAWTFLQSKTSTVSGAKDFVDKTIDKWVGYKTTREQREKIWDIYYRLEEIHPGYFLKDTYGSGELASDIYTISHTLTKSDWDMDVAMERLDTETLDILRDDMENESVYRWSGWM